MCGVNLLLFLGLLSADFVIFGHLSSYIGVGAVWGYNLVTAYVGWILFKRNWRAKRTKSNQGVQVDQTFRAPFFLMMPGLITDGVAMSLMLRRGLQRRRYTQRNRASSLWVGEPDANGIIDVEAVRIDIAEKEPD